MKTNGDTIELQALMNARLWACVQASGGPSQLAKQTGLSPQTLYNMEKNRTFPSAATIKILERAVPDLSIEAIYSDEPNKEWRKGVSVNSEKAEVTQPSAARPELPPPPAVNVERVLHDLDRERREREKLQERYNNLLDRHEKLVDVFLKEKAGVELSFLLASSETPAFHTSKTTPRRFRPQVRQTQPAVKFPVLT